MFKIRQIFLTALSCACAFTFSSCGGDEIDNDEPPYVAPVTSLIDISEIPGNWTLEKVMTDTEEEMFNIPLTFGNLNFEASNGVGDVAYYFDIFNPESWDNDGGTCLTQNGSATIIGFSLTCDNLEGKYNLVYINGGNVTYYDSQSKTLKLRGYYGKTSIVDVNATFFKEVTIILHKHLI